MPNHEAVLVVSGLIGFTPAVAVLFHALRTYDYPHTDHAYFDTSRVFLAFFLGIVLGTISGAFTVALRSSSLVSLVVSLLLLAAFEEGVKLVYLNRKGYRGRFDTTFIGLSMGIGIAALVGAGIAYVNRQDLLLPHFVAPLAVLSASLAFLHAGTGALIGFGCAHGPLLERFLQAYVARALHGSMLVPFIVWSALGRTDVLIPLSSLSAAAVFAFLLYLYVYRRILPETLPQELRRERRRGLRERQKAPRQTVR